MTRIKIGIVEDEMIIARTIETALADLGYIACGAAISYGEALEMIEDEKPDLLLIDINLAGKKSGIDLAEKVNLLYKIPFIFLTANSDLATIDLANAVKPNAYIVKPFIKEELYAAIEIAMLSYKSKGAEQSNQSTELFTFLKEGHQYHKVYFDRILYVESDNNYIVLYLEDNKKIMVRSGFLDFLQSLPRNNFVRIHRSFAVNIDKVDSLELEEAYVNGVKIPISKSYREAILAALKIN